MDAHEVGGLWLMQEMWGFPAGAPEDRRLDYLKVIMACAAGDGQLASGERDWVVGYAAATGAHQATVDALQTYEADESIDDILERNMPVAETWRRAAVFDAIRAAAADHDYNEAEQAAVRRMADKLGVTDEVVSELEGVYADEQELRRTRIQAIFGAQAPWEVSA